MWPIFNAWLSTLESMSLWALVGTHATARLVCIANKNTRNANERQTNARTKQQPFTLNDNNIERWTAFSSFLAIEFSRHWLLLFFFFASKKYLFYSASLYKTHQSIAKKKTHTLKNETIWYIFSYCFHVVRCVTNSNEANHLNIESKFIFNLWSHSIWFDVIRSHRDEHVKHSKY